MDVRGNRSNEIPRTWKGQLKEQARFLVDKSLICAALLSAEREALSDYFPCRRHGCGFILYNSDIGGSGGSFDDLPVNFPTGRGWSNPKS